jgi:hypothetical protein
VRIPIWSTKTITAQWFGSGGPLVDADLHRVGTDRLSGAVTNRQSYPLRDSILAYGRQVYQLGTLVPGATVRVALAENRDLSGLMKAKAPNYLPDQPGSGNAKINRPDLLLALMFHDSESNRSSGHSLSNSVLEDLDLTGQLAVDRPILVARIDRPGAQLALGNAPSTPKVDQTTMLRVILPLQQK